MAFNFNWSPLTADADFYSRAQEMLTTALNKSPKPPIIVDDILVNELNLGSVPPELEILEIGDLAEDRFRGIFKMCYSGDAFLTLKTRVQVRRTFILQLRNHRIPLFYEMHCPWMHFAPGYARNYFPTLSLNVVYQNANISTTGEPHEYISLFKTIFYVA